MLRAIRAQSMEFSEHNVEYGYTYESGAVVSDGTPAPEPVDEIRLYEPSTRPGRAAAARVDRRRGRPAPPDQGPRAPGRFLLIAGEDGEDWCAAARELADAHGLAARRASASATSTATCSTRAAPGCAIGRSAPAAAILVRPDRFVAWRSAGPSAEPGAELATALAADPRPPGSTSVRRRHERRHDLRRRRRDRRLRPGRPGARRAARPRRPPRRGLRALRERLPAAARRAPRPRDHAAAADARRGRGSGRRDARRSATTTGSAPTATRSCTITPQLPPRPGWEPDYMFFQPDLEAALDARAQRRADRRRPARLDRREARAGRRPRATLRAARRRRPATRAPFAHAGSSAPTARTRSSARPPASRAATSASRSSGSSSTSSRTTWTRSRPAAGCQWCDPRRPTTHIRSGTRHRRWEFMLLPGERAEDFEDEQRVWELLAPWFTPEDGVLTRAHRLRVPLDARRARCASGRVLLAGDAAHLTPPFLGQGLCSGLRDAANIAWKLDLVLRGVAGEALLDTRRPRAPAAERVDHRVRRRAREGALPARSRRRAAERDAALRDAGDRRRSSSRR